MSIEDGQKGTETSLPTHLSTMSVAPSNDTAVLPDSTPAIHVTGDDGVEKMIHKADDMSTVVIRGTMTPSSDLSAVRAVAPFNRATTCNIISQVEYYFCDQNLPTDANLLGLSGTDGCKPVSINTICGWRRMRQYKPRKAIKDVLMQSAVLDVVDGGKVKRRFPLMIKPVVLPTIDLERQHIEQTLADNPHLTKNMLKPTGFEEYYTDPPITPQQYERDQKLYDPDFSFEIRIENAIRQYRTRRKMHQSTLRVFELWMKLGGIDVSAHAFSGGLDPADLEGLDKDEIAAMKCTYGVDDFISHNEEEWKVDFEVVALAFLSTEFPTYFAYDSPEEVCNVCNVMVNFFNFLLHHDVCPEYAESIHAARQAVKQAEHLLNKIPAADTSLHVAHSFQAACSVLHDEGYIQHRDKQSAWASPYASELTIDDADLIFKAGLTAFATTRKLIKIEKCYEDLAKTPRIEDLDKSSSFKNIDIITTNREDIFEDAEDEIEPTATAPTPLKEAVVKQIPGMEDAYDPPDASYAATDASSYCGRADEIAKMDAAESLLKPKSPFHVVDDELMGLEITALETADDKTAAYFDMLTSTKIPRMGVMCCRKWNNPRAAPVDVPQEYEGFPENLRFIVNEEVLQNCEVGMKLEAFVKQLDIGVYWIDRLDHVLPKFFTVINDFKEVKRRRRQVEIYEDWLEEGNKQTALGSCNGHYPEDATHPSEVAVAC